MSAHNLFIISGPTGSGKDALITQLGRILPLERITTTTARAPRPGESEGKPYYFITPEAFRQAIVEEAFAEYSANENGVLYGVTKEELSRVTTETKHVGIWQIDWKGVLSAKKMFPGIIAICISAPLTLLEQRLRARDHAKEEIYFTERLAYAAEWLTHTDIYDYVVENQQDKLGEAVQEVANIIRKHANLSSF